MMKNTLLFAVLLFVSSGLHAQTLNTQKLDSLFQKIDSNNKGMGLTLKPEDLDSYLGVYSSPTFPLKITITKNENVLIAQATGQASIPLEAFEKDKFRFQQANLVLEFKPSENQMILLQNGMRFELTKE